MTPEDLRVSPLTDVLHQSVISSVPSCELDGTDSELLFPVRPSSFLFVQKLPGDAPPRQLRPRGGR